MIHIPCSLNISSMAVGRGNASGLFSPSEPVLSTAATCSILTPSSESLCLLAEGGGVKEEEEVEGESV